jgi:hypothetical protein
MIKHFLVAYYKSEELARAEISNVQDWRSIQAATLEVERKTADMFITEKLIEIHESL